MLRLSFLMVIFIITACSSTGNGFKNVPELGNNEKIIWNYVCNKGGFLVEYANLSGSYTATIMLPTKEKRVLDRIGNANQFKLGNLEWRSENEGLFSYLVDGEVEYEGCVARNEFRSDDLQLHLNLNFGSEK